MSTIYDFLTVAIFIGIVGFYFYRQREGEEDLSRYIIAAVGCALANYFGNGGYHIAAIGLILITFGFIYQFIYKVKA